MAVLRLDSLVCCCGSFELSWVIFHAGSCLPRSLRVRGLLFYLVVRVQIPISSSKSLFLQIFSLPLTDGSNTHGYARTIIGVDDEDIDDVRD